VEATYIPVCPSGPTTTSDPSCARRNLDGVDVTVRDASGATVAQGRTGPDGTVTFALDPGEYVIEGSRDPRARIRPSPQKASLASGGTVTGRLLYASAFQ